VPANDPLRAWYRARHTGATPVILRATGLHDFLDAKYPLTKIMRVESHHLHCDSVAGRPR
jgi:hypothetical protein